MVVRLACVCRCLFEGSLRVAMRCWQGFQGEWLWQGTSDMSAWLSAPAALYVVSCIGREKWMQHNSTLLKEAAGLLCKAFGTEHALGADTPYACMAAIELPSGLPLSTSAPDAQHLQRILRERFKIEASPGCMPHSCSSAGVPPLQCDGLQSEGCHAGTP